MLDKGTNTLENVIILIDRIIFIRKIILLDFVTNMTFDDPISSFPTNFKEHVSTNLGLKTCVLKKISFKGMLSRLKYRVVMIMARSSL